MVATRRSSAARKRHGTAPSSNPKKARTKDIRDIPGHTDSWPECHVRISTLPQFVEVNQHSSSRRGGCLVLSGDDTSGPTDSTDSNPANPAVSTASDSGSASADYDVLQDQQKRGKEPAIIIGPKHTRVTRTRIRDLLGAAGFCRPDLNLSLGSGTFGCVFSLGQNCMQAAKVMLVDDGALNTELNYDFMSVASLHDNLLGGDDVLLEPKGTDGFRLGCLIMPKMDLTMKQWLAQAGIDRSPMRTMSLMQQLLDGVNYLHDELEYVHTDIKPANIFVVHDDSGEPTFQIADLGAAIGIDFLESRSAHQVFYLTSRWYRAPEVILEGKLGFGMDLWSVGVIAAEYVTGLPLFPGGTPNDMMEMFVRVLGAPEADFVNFFPSLRAQQHYFTHVGSQWAHQPLPAGWEQVKDQVTNQHQFSKSGSLQVDRPGFATTGLGLSQVEQIVNLGTGSAIGLLGPPLGWECRRSKTKFPGRVYFVHRQSNCTQWDTPGGGMILKLLEQRWGPDCLSSQGCKGVFDWIEGLLRWDPGQRRVKIFYS